MNEHPLTLGHVLGGLWRHRAKAGLVWLVVMALVVAGYLVWPQQFDSQGRLYVKMDRNNTSVTPSTSSTAVSIQDTRETEIRSVAEVIQSRAVLDPVVASIGAEEILKHQPFDWLPSLSLSMFRLNDQSGTSTKEYQIRRQQELAINCLRDSLDVRFEKNSSIISVGVRSWSPDLAQRLAQEIFVNTQLTHMRIHAVSGSAEFFNKQFEVQQQELVDAVEDLSTFRNQLGVLSVKSARESLQSILLNLDQNLLSAEVDLDQSAERLAKLTELMKQTAAKIELPKTGVERLSYEESRTEYFRLESERERLIATYTPTHPEVLRLEAQLKELKKPLDLMANDRTESSTTQNPVFEVMQVDLLKAQAAHASNTARLKSLQQKKVESIAMLERLNLADVTADQMERNVDIARQYLAIYTQKRGEAKAMELLDKNSISDVVVAQQPTMPVKHVSPKGSIVLPLGALAGLLAAFALSLYLDRNHLNFAQHQTEIEEVLDLPVLVSLPRVYSSRNMVN